MGAGQDEAEAEGKAGRSLKANEADEPSRTEEDRSGAASQVGEVEGPTARIEEGGISDFH